MDLNVKIYLSFCWYFDWADQGDQPLLASPASTVLGSSASCLSLLILITRRAGLKEMRTIRIRMTNTPINISM